MRPIDAGATNRELGGVPHRCLTVPPRRCSTAPNRSGAIRAPRGRPRRYAGSTRAGTLTAVTGPSGSGKSTLLAILALRERPAGGTPRHRGEPVSALTRRQLQRLRRRHVGTTVLAATHDPRLIDVADRVLHLHSGRHDDCGRHRAWGRLSGQSRAGSWWVWVSPSAMPSIVWTR